MTQNMRLMVVDDHQLFRECLASLIIQRGFTVFELMPNLRDVLDNIRIYQPDIVLININLPNNSAIELTKQISLELTQTRVIILGLKETESTILECVEAGAKGYIANEASINDLLMVIHLVYKGETFCSPRIAYSLFSRVSELARKRHDIHITKSEDLTLREKEILQLIADGLSNKQIAQRLYLSLYTVKNHVHSILEKLQSHNRLEATHYALYNGLLKKAHSQ